MSFVIKSDEFLSGEENVLVTILIVNSDFFATHLSHKSWCNLRAVSTSIYNACRERCMDKLMPNQIVHFRKLRKKLVKYNRMLDTSMMGCGKTYVSVALAKYLNVELSVFAPKSTLNGWRKACKHFGVKILHFHAYTDFQRASVPYLEKVEKRTAELFNVCHESIELEMVPNKRWERRLNRGTLMVLDECHWLKNTSNRSKMIIILTNALFNFNKNTSYSGKNNYLMCLSATPFDKPEHSVRLCRVFGIIKQPKLASIDLRTYMLQYEGLQELIDYCKGVNKIKTKLVKNELKNNRASRLMNEKRSSDIAYKYVIGVIKPLLFTSMKPIEIKYKSDAKNLFCNLTGDDLLKVQKGMQMMDNAIFILGNLSSQLQLGVSAGQALSLINAGMRLIEMGKVNIFARQTKNELNKNSQSKIIIMLNYVDSLKLLKEELKEYNPIVIQGSTPQKKRPILLRQFQEANINHRVLLCNLSMLAQGVDLDDQHGEFPRCVLISPSYHIINLHQATGRVLRNNTKSDSIIRFIYVSQVSREVDVLDRLAKKSEVLRSGLKYEAKMPGDYPTTIESESEPEN